MGDRTHDRARALAASFLSTAYWRLRATWEEKETLGKSYTLLPPERPEESRVAAT